MLVRETSLERAELVLVQSANVIRNYINFWVLKNVFQRSKVHNSKYRTQRVVIVHSCSWRCPVNSFRDVSCPM